MTTIARTEGTAAEDRSTSTTSLGRHEAGLCTSNVLSDLLFQMLSEIRTSCTKVEVSNLLAMCNVEKTG